MKSISQNFLIFLTAINYSKNFHYQFLQTDLTPKKWLIITILAMVEIVTIQIFLITMCLFLFFLSFLLPYQSLIFLNKFISTLCITSFFLSIFVNPFQKLSMITFAIFIFESPHLALILSLSLLRPHQLTSSAHLLKNKAHSSLLVASYAFVHPSSAPTVSTWITFKYYSTITFPNDISFSNCNSSFLKNVKQHEVCTINLRIIIILLQWNELNKQII